ncbi:histidine kinase dimerization/phospho-acceptor domain-containing protein [Bacillus sp. JCM 19034]|uniref:ATP-binding protein n=1 Tax=Bacillus sp. JCM 19034 TaxID=1481928 RepID=UPI000783B0FD|nr:histidine kinase dimerization/phospho-acceptor domain-containing protein [Bacillus sp. JCM 19034]
MFSNIELVPDEVNVAFEKKDLHFIKQYPSTNYNYLSTEHYGMPYVYYDIGMNDIIELQSRELEGTIAVPMSLHSGSAIHANYESHNKRRIYYIVRGILGFFALLSAFYLYKRRNVFRSVDLAKVKSYYLRLPIDIQIVTLVFFAMTALFSINRLNFLPYDFINQLYPFIKGEIKALAFSTFFIAGTWIQALFIKDSFKESFKSRESWKKAIVYRSWLTLKTAFANRKLGTKITLLLLIVFVFGLAFSIVFFEPYLIIPYAFAFFIIGLPVLVILVKQLALFNRIVDHTEQLANGYLGPDLPEKGRSTLAKHARHINSLKSGVRTSQKEQAKSERLKTELISNVSHDLRTPLTSIITYTELLKSTNANDEDRHAYIEIIDRKSKRLKVLIDDLFEASKMASGNLELIKERVDLVQLLQQALAEHSEAINHSTYSFVLPLPIRHFMQMLMVRKYGECLII